MFPQILVKRTGLLTLLSLCLMCLMLFTWQAPTITHVEEATTDEATVSSIRKAHYSRSGAGFKHLREQPQAQSEDSFSTSIITNYSTHEPETTVTPKDNAESATMADMTIPGASEAGTTIGTTDHQPVYGGTMPPMNFSEVNKLVSSMRPFNLMIHPWDDEKADLPYDRKIIAQQQIERHKRITETCKGLPSTDLHKAFAQAPLHSFNNLLYCPILKAGSTNVLRLFCWLYGTPCTKIKNLHPHNQVPKYLSHPSKPFGALMMQRDDHTFSFVSVRNPWTRLVSVYIQKFVETNQGWHFCQIRDRRPHIYRRAMRTKDFAISFREYITHCVIGQWKEGGTGKQNPHWRPQHLICAFCNMDYSFVGKIETMRSDERVFLHEFGFKDIDATIKAANNRLLPNEKANKTTLLYEDLWGTIKESSLKILKEIYKSDFAMFDYPTSPSEDTLALT